MSLLALRQAVISAAQSVTRSTTAAGLWASGVDRTVLEHCPWHTTSFAMLGGMVLTGGLVVAAGGFGLLATTLPAPAAAAGGAVAAAGLVLWLRRTLRRFTGAETLPLRFGRDLVAAMAIGAAAGHGLQLALFDADIAATIDRQPAASSSGQLDLFEHVRVLDRLARDTGAVARMGWSLVAASVLVLVLPLAGRAAQRRGGYDRLCTLLDGVPANPDHGGGAS